MRFGDSRTADTLERRRRSDDFLNSDQISSSTGIFNLGRV